MNTTVDFETAKQLQGAGFDWEAWQANPTALEIIEQMPEETTIQKNGDTWNCWFKVSHFHSDFRGDTCPHIAAAKAYIAWKNGLIE